MTCIPSTPPSWWGATPSSVAHQLSSPVPRLLLAATCLLGLLGAGGPSGQAADTTEPTAKEPAPREALRISVYATAGGIAHLMPNPEGLERVLARLRTLGVSHLFLEGRRGDEHVEPARLKEVRAFFESRGIRCTGGIATVPGAAFGTRQNEALGWLNWESPKTREDVAGFFREDAPVFDELVVDDFYCTGDTSPDSDKARGDRDWGTYRRDLMVSLLKPLVFGPTRSINPGARLIIKFPQWYDRFHMFGYDPARMAEPFDRVWVGTEVRNPETRRMGFVQPTEGYVNFRWIQSVVGPKVEGAWFDHIECTPQNFIDQAYLSVLAGARELTLFNLGDVMDGHPGDALFAERLPELCTLAARLDGRARYGIPYFKPPDSDAADNLYLMDYLAMTGFSILPEAQYPELAKSVILGAQAASDPGIVERMESGLGRGVVFTVTPAFLRKAGPRARALAGVDVGDTVLETSAAALGQDGRFVPLRRALDVDGSVRVTRAKVELASADGVPVFTGHAVRKGRVLVWNVRTFSERNFRDVGEWLLAPRQLGLAELPQPLLDLIRGAVLGPEGLGWEAPAGVMRCDFEDGTAFYNFKAEPVEVRWAGRTTRLGPHQCLVK